MTLTGGVGKKTSKQMPFVSLLQKKEKEDATSGQAWSTVQYMNQPQTLSSSRSQNLVLLSILRAPFVHHLPDSPHWERRSDLHDMKDAKANTLLTRYQDWPGCKAMGDG